MTSQCVYFRVSGKVQGVFFRASTQVKARELGLRGWVRNRQDGDVELVAEGDVQAITSLTNWLWEGPMYAQVQQVVAQACAEVLKMDGFLIQS